MYHILQRVQEMQEQLDAQQRAQRQAPQQQLAHQPPPQPAAHAQPPAAFLLYGQDFQANVCMALSAFDSIAHSARTANILTEPGYNAIIAVVTCLKESFGMCGGVNPAALTRIFATLFSLAAQPQESATLKPLIDLAACTQLATAATAPPSHAATLREFGAALNTVLTKYAADAATEKRAAAHSSAAMAAAMVPCNPTYAYKDLADPRYGAHGHENEDQANFTNSYF